MSTFTQENYNFYNYRLYNILILARPEYKTFSELMNETGIKNPALLSFILSENRKLQRIELIQIPEKLILKYTISPKGEEYTVLLDEFISFFSRLYSESVTPEIIERASRLTDKFIKFPKIDLEKHT
jgi:hypothetical protein